MGVHTLKLILTSVHVFLLTLFTCNPTFGSETSTATPLDETPTACKLINCGQGTCVANGSAALGFGCQCNTGWEKMQLGPLTFPSCVVPNCTLDFQCGDASPPPPPVSVPPAPFNISSPCNLVWCGDGTCTANGSDHICECNKGSANLFNKTNLACFRECSFGADCFNLGLGFPRSSLPAPSPPASGSVGNGSGTEDSYSSRGLRTLTLILLPAILFLVSV
ncbi:hypothetical protein K2173_004303 [Erythroxylum novogranatense]|uniref:Uncharacterized protein n=1 Tax=Erythroxylum novogranatense TaxID=1862640 RepID=A0AAV8U2S1_9ROSI|nr:hypothetical protein K2173_004303 [Erythroxylum novogranatense]